MQQPLPPPLTYRLFSLLLFPLWVGHAAWQAWKYHCVDYLRQRLGGRRKPYPRQAIWLHAASVGEVALIHPLAQTLAKNQSVVVTCFTISGYQHALKTLPDDIYIQVLPIDIWPISRNFMRRCKFRLALIAETELWPETLYQTRRCHIPLLQINARLSHKSLATSGWMRRLLQRTLGYFDAFITRHEDDIERLQAMGVEDKKISLCGNLKYAAAQPHNESPEALIDRPYLLFASTHAPEEVQFAEICTRLDAPPLFVIAPRHPQRASEIMKSLQPLGLNIRQRSRNEPIADDTHIYLADTLGEMPSLMTHARIVIMGGSFAPIGGHNILEPARLGAAIITGPDDDNIRADIDWLKSHQAIIQTPDIDRLQEQIERLLSNEKALEQMRQQARKAMAQQTEILPCYLDHIEKYL